MSGIRTSVPPDASFVLGEIQADLWYSPSRDMTTVVFRTEGRGPGRTLRVAGIIPARSGPAADPLSLHQVRAAVSFTVHAIEASTYHTRPGTLEGEYGEAGAADIRDLAKRAQRFRGWDTLERDGWDTDTDTANAWRQVDPETGEEYDDAV